MRTTRAATRPRPGHLPLGAASLLALLLAGCAAPPPGSARLPLGDRAQCRSEGLLRLPAVDLAVAIDASRSASRPSGQDIDRNGVVGVLFNAGTSDPLDSRLSAQIAAVRTLLDSLAGADVRMSIVSIHGRNDVPTEGREIGLVHWRRGAIRAELTRDRTELERALERLLARGGEGRTDFAAGMRLAVRSLVEAPPEPGRRRMILFMADSESPLVAGPDPLNQPRLNAGGVFRADQRMRSAAIGALAAEAPIHTFALGPAAESRAPHALSRIAGATGGGFTPVGDLSRLHCDLLHALAQRAEPARPAVSQP